MAKPLILLIYGEDLVGNGIWLAVFLLYVACCHGNCNLRMRWYLRCFVHVFSQNTVNTSVFEEVVQKHCKIQHFGHVVLPKCRK